MKKAIRGTGLPDLDVWAAILYFDSGRECDQAKKPTLVPLIAGLSFCFIAFARFCALTIRTGVDDT
jgi:hypothetical protein